MRINPININTKKSNRTSLKKSENFTAKPNLTSENNTALATSKMMKESLLAQRGVSFLGWSPEPQNKDTIEKMTKIIKDKKIRKIAISGHRMPDGDSIGSTFAMANLINQATGKKVDLFVFDKKLANKYAFLNTNKSINVILYDESYEKMIGNKKDAKKYDLAISCDTSETKLMPENFYKKIYSKASNKMKIDHHPLRTYTNSTKGPANNKFGDLNIIDDSMPAAAEIVMQFVNPLGLNPENINKTARNAILAGIISDTNGLKYSKSHLQFEDVALLVKSGVDYKDIYMRTHGNIHKLALEAEFIAAKKIQYSEDGKIAYFIEDDEINEAKKACEEAGIKQEGKEAIKKNVCERLPEIEGVEVGFKVSSYSDKLVFSIRSRNVDVSKIAVKHNGGGHKNASAFEVPLNERSVDEVVQSIIEELNATVLG